jgi:hypothetical protein
MTIRPTNDLEVGATGTTASEEVAWLHQLNDFIGGLPGGSEREQLSISVGAITPSRSLVRVDTEGGAAADDLTTIATTNLPLGSFLILYLQDASRKVTVKHGASGSGHIYLTTESDLLLNSTTQALFLVRELADRWREVGRFYGSQVGLMRSYLELGAAALLGVANEAEAKGGVSAKLVDAINLKKALTDATLLIGQLAAETTAAGSHELLVKTASGLRRMTRASALSGYETALVVSGEITPPSPVRNWAPTPIAHGLPARPRRHFAVMRCIDAGGEYGWAEGHEVAIRGGDQDEASGTTTTISTTFANATHVGFRLVGNLVIPRLDADGYAAPSAAKWRLVLYYGL